jgi:hypothetical protein
MPPLPPGFENAGVNRAAFPPDKLLPYLGQWIAWNADSTAIVESGATIDEIEEKLATRRIDASQVIYEHVADE